MKTKSFRQRAAEQLALKESQRRHQEWSEKMRLEREGEADARATGRLTSKNRPFADLHAIAGAGGDPQKDQAILQGTYFGEHDYRPNILNEPRPEEQQSRDFTPAWDTTYGGPYERKPDPRPQKIQPRNGELGERFATSMANDFADMDWMDRESTRRAQDAEREEVVRARANSTNVGRDRARPPIRLRDPN